MKLGVYVYPYLIEEENLILQIFAPNKKSADTIIREFEYKNKVCCKALKAKVVTKTLFDRYRKSLEGKTADEIVQFQLLRINDFNFLNFQKIKASINIQL